jgi:predicted RNA polymerase sigma factor
VPLTLREVCDLTTEQIARAFLQSPTTIAQRIVRAKAKIREAGIPYQVPELNELPERLESVLRVIYLVFNEGYSASSGEALPQQDLSDEAIRLAVARAVAARPGSGRPAGVDAAAGVPQQARTTPRQPGGAGTAGPQLVGPATH